MNFLTQPKSGEIGVLVSPRSGPGAGYKALLKLTAVLSLQSSVVVLDCGNRFNVYQVARLVRRQTPQVMETLDRIHVARAFTCYQVVTLLSETAVTRQPKIIIDLLATFYDENVSINEAHRLLKIVLGRIQEMHRLAPILVSLHQPPQPERAGLVTAVCNIADHVLIHEQPPTYQSQRLF
jgi:hypothetical protein